MAILLVILIAYLLGSIPFGLLLTRAAGLGDIRAIGSGNIGATNVMRTGNKKLGALTLLLDGGKGWLAVTIAYWFIHHAIGNRAESDAFFGLEYIWGASIAVVLGHIAPIWLKGKGGKGVATAFGAILGISFLIGVIGLVSWLTIFLITRISSISAIASIIIIPLAAFLSPMPDRAFVFPFVVIAILVVWRHKDNIRRLLNGTERGFRKEKL